MKTVYKYTLGPFVNEMQLPIGAEILSVGVQDGAPMYWALVDLTLNVEPIMLLVLATGETWPNGYTPVRFIGRIDIDGGAYVWHVFEVQRS